MQVYSVLETTVLGLVGQEAVLDPVLPHIEADISRRRRRRLFSHSRVPVRMLVPNFFTLLGLCAGLTSIRMSIEERWDVALAAIVFAALLDGIDGRVARLLKASSRFGAELDSLADFVNFGVAPAILLFTWGLVDVKSIGWICVLIFALASALRLARFNVAVDDEKPKWQSNFFIGMPTPAAAIVVLLVTGSLLSLWQARQATTARDEATAVRHKSAIPSERSMRDRCIENRSFRQERSEMREICARLRTDRL